ncbi:MAG TPA: HAMP domain-containing sensor histidine kinase [Dehalococcoidia bacterium]|nr:HAMP domain-containing sensor histidine kinase [Dehalococcoidia bacterium]
MSIRLRLTLVYSVILGLTLIAFGAALYLTVSQVLSTVAATPLVEEAHRLINNREWDRNRVVLPATRIAAPTTYVQTREAGGQVTARTANLGDVTLPLSESARQAVLEGNPLIERAEVEDGRLLIYTKALDYQGQTYGIVQVARPLEAHDRALTALRTILVIGGGLALVIAFGLGWILSGLALRPIQRISKTARAIGRERDFDRRVSYSGPSDELGRLVTTFNEMLTELQATYRQVEQALQAQRRFVAPASHELRTPLTTIRGNLALLQRRPPIDASDREAVLADLADESDRLIRLVNDLLVLARADAGQRLRRSAVAVGPLIDDVCRQARLLSPERTIAWEAGPDLTVTADRDALKQVLLILIDNAIKHTPRHGPIRLGTSVDGRRGSISVRDTGPGIDPRRLPHIFDRFYRGDTSRTGVGAGLGLAIARALIEAQDGAPEVRSGPGRGSTFTILLPIGGPAADRVEPAVPGVPAAGAAPHA